MRKIRGFLLIFLLFLQGCSIDNFNPFHSNKIYYIEGDDIPTSDSFVDSKKTPTLSKARMKATMKPYCVNGKVYKPTYVEVGDSMSGIASWYGPNFHGHLTSSGEYYNMYDMTVAHKTWPMNTMVKITNLDNGKSVIARVNDRGPFVKGRIVDCSYAVAKKLGFDKKGTCNARIDVIGFAGKVYNPKSGKPKPKVRLTNFGVQVGAFAILANAKNTKAKFDKLVCNNQYVTIKKRQTHKGLLNTVVVMGFNSRDEAQDFIDKLNIPGAFIIRD